MNDRELKRAHKELWQQRMAELDIQPTVSPEFAIALRRLVEVHEYGDTDIGIMFGVSRERVRQWRERWKIDQVRRGSGYRYWNAQLNRFLVTGRKQYNRIVSRRKRPARRERRLAQRKAMRLKMIAAYRALEKRLGRTPTVQEMDSIGVSRKMIRAYWSPSHLDRSILRTRYYLKAIGRFSKATGYEPRPRGPAGHIDNSGDRP